MHENPNQTVIFLDTAANWWYIFKVEDWQCATDWSSLSQTPFGTA